MYAREAVCDARGVHRFSTQVCPSLHYYATPPLRQKLLVPEDFAAQVVGSGVSCIFDTVIAAPLPAMLPRR